MLPRCIAVCTSALCNFVYFALQVSHCGYYTISYSTRLQIVVSHCGYYTISYSTSLQIVVAINFLIYA
jgi:hypothetical protein